MSIIIRDLPKFPPLWMRIGGGPSKAGLIGHLRHVRLSHSRSSLAIIIEEEGSHFVGYYHAAPETLQNLCNVMQKAIGRPLALVAEMELPG
ncbi:MAG TPA: hypothetical protein VNL14_08275 [Candidatus Acidoferrales bacterium]|nr:hypothetical protein [Candidatus Acidoferrales bacterium]